MFPGQGAQTVGMGKDLYDKYEEIREVYKKASEISGKDIAELTFNSTMEELSKTENTQLAIATMSLGILKVLENKGIRPDITVGLSLGEYPALISGGYLSFEDGITLLKHRGYLMGNKIETGNYSMAAIIGLDSKIIEEVCAEIAEKGMFISPANYNYSGQTVISGDEEAINIAIEALKEKTQINEAVKTGFGKINGFSTFNPNGSGPIQCQINFASAIRFRRNQRIGVKYHRTRQQRMGTNGRQNHTFHGRIDDRSPGRQ